MFIAADLKGMERFHLPNLLQRRQKEQKAKDKARAALGGRFDPRAFHAQVLNTGALPLPVLESKIDAWIAAGGKP